MGGAVGRTLGGPAAVPADSSWLRRLPGARSAHAHGNATRSSSHGSKLGVHANCTPATVHEGSR